MSINSVNKYVGLLHIVYTKNVSPTGSVEHNIAIKSLDSFLQGSNGLIQTLTPTIPLSVRMICQAQQNDLANNGENVRMKSVFYGTFIGIGWIGTVAARLIRVVMRTALLVFSLIINTYYQIRYASVGENRLSYSLVAEDLRRYGYEWVDLVVALILIPVYGIVNLFSPQACNTRVMCEAYGNRIADITRKDAEFRTCQNVYNQAKTRQHENYTNAQTLPFSAGGNIAR